MSRINIGTLIAALTIALLVGSGSVSHFGPDNRAVQSTQLHASQR